MLDPIVVIPACAAAGAVLGRGACAILNYDSHRVILGMPFTPWVCVVQGAVVGGLAGAMVASRPDA